METTQTTAVQQPADVLSVTRTFEAPRSLVFKAWTEPERVVRWWGPKGFTTPYCTIDLRPQGVLHSCMRSPEGRDYWSRNVYREIVEPERIVCTDSFADEQGNPVSPRAYGMSPDWPEEALITVTFAEADGRTRLTIEHAPLKPGPERDMCQQGWNESLDKLADYLAEAQGRAIPATMRAVALDRFGGVEELVLRTLPVPEVGPEEVLIRVESAGVAVWDPFEREGGFAGMFGTEPTFPYVLGSDGAGIVVAVGERVSRFKAGDRVYAAALTNAKGGFYAQYAAVNEETVAPMPGQLTTEQAGALASDAMTALRGLEEVLKLKEGESVMIFGASGGIGHLAVQLAKRKGVRVFAVASGEDGVALARRLGADAVVEGHTQDVAAAARDFAPQGLDAALLTAGGEPAERALAAVREGGRVAYPHGVEPEPEPRPSLTLQGYDVAPGRAALDQLNRLIEAPGTGPFEVHIARTFSLEQAADAHRALAEHFLGKLALRPN